jgi:lipopolysaccharide export system permease protein
LAASTPASFSLKHARLFERALLREFTGLAAAVFSVLLSIMLVMTAARLLANAASGSVASEAVLALLGFSLLTIVPWLLTLTGFVTVLWALTRAYRDHEMVVWFASGLSLTAWIRPVLAFALPLALLSAALSLGLKPWAEAKSREYREQLAARDDMSSLPPGLFKESMQSDRVYFIENYSGANGAARNIFMQSERQGEQMIIVAEQGFLKTLPDGERWLTLQRGRQYQGRPGALDYRVTEFETAQVRIDPAPPSATSPVVKAMSTMALWHSNDPEHQAELAYRFAIPISLLLLAVAAIPLAFVNPRMGRAYNLIFAFLLVSIYSNLINIAQSWIAHGQLPAMIGLLPVYLLLIGLTVAMFRWRGRAGS